MIALAFAAGFAVQLVRLPPMVGFLAAGFALNALGFERSPALDTIANLGVTLLLFTIGLKLDIRTLLRAEVWATATAHIVAPSSPKCAGGWLRARPAAWSAPRSWKRA